MIGMELETTVEEIIETNMPNRRPVKASSTWRCDMASLGAAEAGADKREVLSGQNTPRRVTATPP